MWRWRASLHLLQPEIDRPIISLGAAALLAPAIALFLIVAASAAIKTAFSATQLPSSRSFRR